MSINTKGSVWRKWDFQVQTILDDGYVELKDYYLEIKSSRLALWESFTSEMGGETSALKYDSKAYVLDEKIPMAERFSNYARVLFTYLKIFKPDLGLIAFTDHNYCNESLIDYLYEYSKKANCKCICGVEINANGVHMLVYFETPPFEQKSFSDGIKIFLSHIDVNKSKNSDGVLTVSGWSVAKTIDKIEEEHGLYVFPHCNSNNGLFQERGKTDRTHLSDMFNYRDTIFLQCRSKTAVTSLQDYISTKPELFKSHYFFSISADSRKLEDIGAPDEQGNFTWVKADCIFNGLRQIMIERDRVFIGEEPELLKRMHNNPTKFIKSLHIRKKAGASTEDIWFDKFSVELNAGLVAIIGKKGAGKSAITDIIGLCGNTHQDPGNFSFLTNRKFRKVKPENLSEKFEGEIIWRDGTPVSKSLSDNPDKRLPERVRYIPQNFLEKLCSDVESDDFEKEIKQIIFSHTPSESRLGKSSLDDLINFKSSIVMDEIEIIKNGINKVNNSIIDLEIKNSDNYKAEIESLKQLKETELSAHEKIKPVKPVTDDSQPPSELQNKIAKIRVGITKLEEQIETLQSESAALVLKEEELNKAKQFFEGLNITLDKIKDDPSSQVLGKNQIELSSVFTYTVNLQPIEKVLQELESDLIVRRNALNPSNSESLMFLLKTFNVEMALLQEQLDRPAKEEQKYLDDLKSWETRRKKMEGSPSEEGTLNYFVNHLKYLNEELNLELEKVYDSRNNLIGQVYDKKQQLVSIRRDLFKPVTNFIESLNELKERYDVKLNVSLEYKSFLESFFNYLNQGRVGSFSGREEGYKRMKDVLDKTHFENKEGFVAFANEVIEHLKFDKRTEDSAAVDINSQLRKGFELSQLYDFIFQFDYLEPVYKLNLGNKSLLELSPGERGALLLIFYLILDKDDIPLLIDQPEENLDNESVYHILVHFIKRVKDQRQIIIVTHNPNLAVVCDAEQLIHMNIEKENKNKVTFDSGSIENSTLNRAAVNILEGTLPAFNNRDSKYIRAGGRKNDKRDVVV